MKWDKDNEVQKIKGGYIQKKRKKGGKRNIGHPQKMKHKNKNKKA